MIRALAIVIAAISLSGCVMSLQEVRSTQPIRSASFKGDYWQIANCTLDGMQTSPRSVVTLEPSWLRYHIVQLAAQQRATITGFLDVAYQAPMIDLAFIQRGPEVLIESRWGGFGDTNVGARRIDERTWPIIERCAGTQMPLSAERPAVQPPANNAPSVRLGVRFYTNSSPPVVGEVLRQGPAEAAGIRVGDVFVSFDGHTTTTSKDVVDVLLTKRPGDAVNAVVARGGSQMTLLVRLGAR